MVDNVGDPGDGRCDPDKATWAVMQAWMWDGYPTEELARAAFATKPGGWYLMQIHARTTSRVEMVEVGS